MAALTKIGFNFVFIRNSALLRSTVVQSVSVNCCRGKKVWLRPVLKSLYWRKLEQGPESERPRSDWINWNYNSEIFSFGKRLGEEFDAETLRTAFTHKSFVKKEQLRRAELKGDGDGEVLHIPDNEDLVARGEQLSRDYIRGYLRSQFPALPEEAIWDISDYLLSDDTLAYIGANLGVKDLILCEEFPPLAETVSATLKAVIGALEDQGGDVVQRFVRDFVLPQLIGQDVNEMWSCENPMGVLAGVLRRHGRGDPDPRLLFQTGSETIEAAYLVGIYSDRQLVGKGYGETVTIAEEMAARNALKRFFGTLDFRLRLGKDARDLHINTESRNVSLQDYQAESTETKLH